MQPSEIVIPPATLASLPTADDPSMRTLESGPNSRLDVAAIALIGIFWTAMAFAIDPRGDFPLNDDWAYGLPAKALVERGEYRLTEWSCPTLTSQAIWGALFCAPTGFSYTSLRISTLVLGLIGLIGLYGLLRQFGARPMVALFGVGTVGANPLYVSLSYTFMTDVPFASLAIVSVFLLIRGMARESAASIWMGLALALASVFIRQIGLGIFFAFVMAYPFWRGFGRSWLLQAVVPAVLAVLALKAYERGLIACDRLPRMYYKVNEALSEGIHDLIHMAKGSVRSLVYRILEFLAYIGLFTAPFSLLLWTLTLGRKSRRGRTIELGGVAGLTVVLVVLYHHWRGLMPSGGNIILDFALGSRFSLSGDWPGPMPRAIAWGLTVFSLLGGVLGLEALARVAWSVVIRPANPEAAAWRPGAILLLVTSAFFCGPPTIAHHPQFDRYYLPATPMVIGLIWMAIHSKMVSEVPRSTFLLRPIGLIAGLLGLVLLLAFSLAGTHDYMDWNRARWSTVRSLASELAISPDEIDGGWEYNNLLPNEARLYKSHEERDSMFTDDERAGRSVPHALDKSYRIALSPSTGYDVIRRIPLSPWLPLAPGELVLLKKAGTSPPAR